jgi:hypothetical protein
VATLGVVALAALASIHQGCGGKSSSGEQGSESAALPEECEAYLSALRSCVAALGVANGDPVATQRATLLAAGTKRSAKEQREACAAARSQLTTSCR